MVENYESGDRVRLKNPRKVINEDEVPEWRMETLKEYYDLFNEWIFTIREVNDGFYVLGNKKRNRITLKKNEELNMIEREGKLKKIIKGNKNKLL